MELPRLDAETKRLYESVLPSDARVQTRAMFGGLGSFVNGNMFGGALGDRIFVRLPEEDREALRREPGTGPFEPVKGHAMAEYVAVPVAWKDRPDRLRRWMDRAFQWVAAMPPKKKRGKASRDN